MTTSNPSKLTTGVPGAATGGDAPTQENPSWPAYGLSGTALINWCRDFPVSAAMEIERLRNPSDPSREAVGQLNAEQAHELQTIAVNLETLSRVGFGYDINTVDRNTLRKAAIIVRATLTAPNPPAGGEAVAWQYRIKFSYGWSDWTVTNEVHRDELLAEISAGSNRVEVRPLYATSEAVALDARRYRRLQLLGCAPGETEHLRKGNVMRFTNLDAFVDADLKAHPSRGEAEPLYATPDQHHAPPQQSVAEGVWELCELIDRRIARLRSSSDMLVELDVDTHAEVARNSDEINHLYLVLRPAIETALRSRPSVPAPHVEALVKALEFFASDQVWRRGERCDPNSGAFCGQQVAIDALTALNKAGG